VGIFDRSKSETNQTLIDQTTTNTKQTDQSGGLLTFADVGGGIALDLSSRESLTDDRDIYDSRTTNTTLSDSGAIAAGRELGVGALGVARDSLSSLERVNADSLKLLSGLADKSIDASRTLARDAAASGSDFLETAIGGLSSLAKQNSQTSDDRLTKVVGIALAAVAAVVVLPAIFKSGAKAVI
jgi:hypothetical protein